MITMARRLALSAVVVAGGLVGTAGVAHAVPTGCTVTTQQPGDIVKAKCTSGTGEVRAGVECILVPPGRDPILTVHYGPWVGVGQTSQTSCPGGPSIYDVWHEVR